MPPVPFVRRFRRCRPSPRRRRRTRRRDPRRRRCRRARRFRRFRRARRGAAASRRRAPPAPLPPAPAGRRRRSRRRRCPRSRRPAAAVAAAARGSGRVAVTARARAARRAAAAGVAAGGVPAAPPRRRRSVRRCFPRSPRPWPAAGRRTQPVTATSPNSTSARPRFRRPASRVAARRLGRGAGLKRAVAWVKVERWAWTYLQDRGCNSIRSRAPARRRRPRAPSVSRPLDEYFALGGHMFCHTCIDGFRNSGSFLRALLFGAAAAVVGSVVWALVATLTHASWGIIGVAVGLFVGTAVRRGSARPAGLEIPGACDGAHVRCRLRAATFRAVIEAGRDSSPSRWSSPSSGQSV